MISNWFISDFLTNVYHVQWFQHACKADKKIATYDIPSNCFNMTSIGELQPGLLKCTVRSNFPRTVTFWWNFQKSEIINRRCVKYLESFKNSKITHIMTADIILTHLQHITNIFNFVYWNRILYMYARFGLVHYGPVQSDPLRFFFQDLSNSGSNRIINIMLYFHISKYINFLSW